MHYSNFSTSDTAMRTLICLLYLMYTSTYLTVANGKTCGIHQGTGEALVEDINYGLNRLTSTLADIAESCAETSYSVEPLPAGIKEISCETMGAECDRGPCRFLCPPGCSNMGHGVRGDYYYTTDSYICQAAVHAGFISDSDGGEVIVALGRGATNYEGTTRNGVTSLSYPATAYAIYFIKGLVTTPQDTLPVPHLTAECEEQARWVCSLDLGPCRIWCPPGCASANQTVWGTTFYKGDSSLCKAAIHDGRISDSNGGYVNLAYRYGDESYVGSTKNGVTTKCMWCPPGCNDYNTAVWGTDNVFTDNSGVCRAAIHEGVIADRSGGYLKVYKSVGRASYAGATRHHVTTDSYGAWEVTMSLESSDYVLP